MKIRNGFVSNSSTSSFCIFGAAIEKEEFIEKIRELNPKLNAKYEALENGEVLKEKDGDTEYEIGEEELNEDAEVAAEKSLSKVGLNLVCGYYEDECYYVGRYWYNIKDDETGKKFRESVKKSVKSLFPKAKCETIEQAWHD